MRILLLVDSYLPGTKAGGKLIHDLGVELKSRGHNVDVLTPSPLIRTSVEISIEDGLRIIRVRMGNIKTAPKAIRAVHEIRLSSVLWKKARLHLLSNPADLIIFYSPTIFLAPLVARLKSLWRCPSYLVLRDIFPQWAVDIGILKRGLIWRYFRRRELAQYSSANIIAVQSAGDLKYFSDHFPKHRYTLEVLRNWTRETAFNSRAKNFRDQLGLGEKIVFVYGGNMGVAQDMGNLLRLAKNVANHGQIHFLFVGEGSESVRMKEIVAESALSNVTILPPLSQQDFLALLSECDVGLLSLDRRLKTQNVPGKLLGYLTASLPTLASVNPGSELFELFGTSGAGLCFTNGHDAALSAAAIRLAGDIQIRAEMARFARQMLREHFSVEAAADQILAHFSIGAIGALSKGSSVLESVNV